MVLLIGAGVVVWVIVSGMLALVIGRVARAAEAVDRGPRDDAGRRRSSDRPYLVKAG